MDPAFRLAQCVSHSMASSIFILFEKMNFIYSKMTWSRHLFLFLFLKGKQNKKKNPKCDSLFWKRWSKKNRIGFGGRVTYREGTVKTVTLLWVPKVGSLLIKWSNHDNWWGNLWIFRVIMHMWESKQAYRKTRKGEDAYLGDKPQCAIKK